MSLVKYLKNNWQIAIIIFLALILRFIALAKYGDFWDDELFNVIYSQKPWPDGLLYWLWETNPPLHLFFLKLWFFIVPATEFFARLPSVIVGTATVAFLYQFGNQWFRKNIALLSALYLAVHPYHIFWSATARVYVFLMLLVLLSTSILIKKYFVNGSQNKNSTALCIINFLLIMSHLSSLFFIAGQFIVLFIFKGWKSVWSWLKNNLPAFIIGGLWIAGAFIIKFNNNLPNSWFLNLNHTFKSAVNPLINLIMGKFNLQIVLALLALYVLIIILWFLAKKQAPEENKKMFILLALIGWPIIFSAALGVWHIKFFVLILPLFVLFFSRAIFDGVNNKILAYIFILTICAIGYFNLMRTLPLVNWSSINNFILQNQQKENTVFIYNDFFLKYQVDRYLENLPVPIVPLILYDNIRWEDTMVKYNYLLADWTDEQIDEWYEKYNLDKYEKIILLERESALRIGLVNIFINNKGWQLIKGPAKAEMSGPNYLYVFEKNI